MQGISERASKHITGARKQGTIANYGLDWAKWSRWCGEQKVDPVRCSIKYVLDFLAYLFGTRFEYSTINSHRSAISTHRDHVENSPVGQHPKVSVLMKGVFNANQPKPKYVFAWGVEKILSYFNDLPMNEEV